MDRRKFLQATAGVASVTALAGCQSPAEINELQTSARYYVEELDEGFLIEVEGVLSMDCNSCFMPERVEVDIRLVNGETREIISETTEQIDTLGNDSVNWNVTKTLTDDNSVDIIDVLEIEVEPTAAWDDGEQV